MRRYILFLILLLSTIFSCRAGGQGRGCLSFENIDLGTEASVISCFLQDTQGLMWIGSDKGLFSYDGYTEQAHFTLGGTGNTRIYCGEVVDSTYLYLGADNGLLIYNYRTDRYENVEVDFPRDIRALAMYDGCLWLGTLNGLYTYCPHTRKLTRIEGGIPHHTIYSLLSSTDHSLYIGTYNGCCRYRGGRFESLSFPADRGRNNLFVNSLLEDVARRCIWIGTEGYLYKYTPDDGNVQQIDAFHDNSVKSLALDGDGRLLAGTDNGLYIYQEGTALQHVVHDSRNSRSLSNNIIWTILAGSEKNIWLGTDDGISLLRHNNPLRYIPISRITGTGEGNRFYSMLQDSRGNYWFGGTNGLIRFTPVDLESQAEDGSAVTGSRDVTWYKMGDKKHPFPHNRVRQLYEDRDGQLWAATDGSISRYDAGTGQFITYSIVDSTRRYNTNWAYSLFEDSDGQLWIATCLGGIFVVDKQKLIHSSGSPYVAEKNYSVRNGLSGMFVNQMIADNEGNVWILLYNSPDGIEKINARTDKVTPVATGKLRREQVPNYIMCAGNGMIWVGFSGGLMRIQPSDNSVRILPFDAYSHSEVLSMMEAEGKIWVSTTDGLWVADQRTLKVRRLNVSDRRFTGMFFDKKKRDLYLGAVDGFAIASSEALLTERPERPLLFTALYVNNRPYRPDAESSLPSVRYMDRITLDYNRNNLAFELSDLPYSCEEKSKLVYYLEGLERDWKQLPPDVNRITYSNLVYGNYRLRVGKLDPYGKLSREVYSLDVRILPPWYYTPWAKALYALLCLVLIVWIVNFFRVRNRLKQEREEKEKILEQSRAKMDFFTNLSHDLKTPLGMITAPLSMMLPEMKFPEAEERMRRIQCNAMKLNSLIRQGLDFDRGEDGNDVRSACAQVELVSFARGIFDLYAEEKAGGKQLSLEFQATGKCIYIHWDAIKLESVLDNLLSNAVKYTPQGGKVTLSLEVPGDGSEAYLTVSDTGIGIPLRDQPYVFRRFFQASNVTGKKEGAGVGLHLVKTYTELHGGSVKLVSRENEGTAVTLTLPVDSLRMEAPESVPLKEIEAVSYDEKFLSNVVRLIEEHLSDSELNVNALCDWAATNNKQMYRKLKQLTGMTPVEYIKFIRMKKAAMLLQQKKFTVAEVMYMVGFSNHSYFSKCFQAEFGVTPKQYMSE